MDPSHVLWIGGGDSSGRAGVAVSLGERFGLPVYSVSAHDRDHAERMPQSATFAAASRHRFRLVLEDLAKVSGPPGLIVEGAELLPTSVSAVLREPSSALFLLAEPGEEIDRLVEREARELRLVALRATDPLEAAAEHFAPALERVSGARGTSP
jgi:hypothetical protein